jgi:hypothetical protein
VFVSQHTISMKAHCDSLFSNLLPTKSLGKRNKIQVSQSTADLLLASGKGHWLKSRKGGVTAKGKGVLSTFWLNPTAKKRGSSIASSVASSGSDMALSLVDPALEPKTAEAIVKQGRLVEWMVELLLDPIKKIVSYTLPTGSLSSNIRPWHEVSHTMLLLL